MKTLSTSSLAALTSGLVAFFAIHWLWPAIPVEYFTNVIGLAALVGAGAGVWWSRRRAMSAPPQPAPGVGKDETDRP